MSPGLQAHTRKITYVYDDQPLVSIVIPNKDHKEDLKTCIDSIRRLAGDTPYEILVVENNSTSQEIFSYYKELTAQSQPAVQGQPNAQPQSDPAAQGQPNTHPQSDPDAKGQPHTQLQFDADAQVRILTYEGAFNYSKINNFAARQARGEYLLFLNNDTELITPGCLTELLNYARRPDVGAVGAQLFYGDDTVQHAGVILGYGGVAGHAFEGTPRSEAEKITHLTCARAYGAVTAACMMVRRSLFESLGGFDEALGVAYNDIDLCLRIGQAGKKVICTPYAQLFHYESQTRGLELTDEKARRVRRETELFLARWGALIKRGDPCYNPNLTLEAPDFSLRR